MPPHDVSDGRRSDPTDPTVPPTIVAETDDAGRVTIYDEHRRRAWIRSTHAISIRNVP
ncbi:hypothetical protein ACLI4Z_02050 [Natrialbaceae archaeon A-arb3/5]